MRQDGKRQGGKRQGGKRQGPGPMGPGMMPGMMPGNPQGPLGPMPRMRRGGGTPDVAPPVPPAH
jgi:hypothetical protein